MKRFPPARLTLLALAATCLPPAAMADTPAEPTTEPVAASAPAATDETARLPTITVRTGLFRQSADELVHPVDIVTGDELESRRRGTLGEVLEHRPGIANGSFGPGAGRPIIRGQGGPRVQVLDNGISTMDASSISPDHAVAVDPLNADRVEIIKGPATLIYGGAASAGVVNVIDDRLPDTVTPGFRLKGDGSYGDNGHETNTAFRARYGVGPLQFGGNYARRDANDFEIPGDATRVAADGGEPAPDAAGHRNVLENSALTSESYGGGLTWVGRRGSLGGVISRFETDYGIPGSAHAHDPEAEAEPATEAEHGDEGVRIQLEQTRVDLRGVLHDPLPGFERLETRIGLNDYRHQEVEPDGGIGTTFDVQEHEGRVELAHLPVAGWAGVVGLQVSDRAFEAVGDEAFVPPVDTRGVGLFWVEGRDVGAHRLELGARVDRIRHQPQDGGNPNRDFTPVSLSAGVNLLLAEHLHLRLNAQRAQRAPAAEALYAFGPHLATRAFERGNQNLDPETANNLDVSLALDQGRWTWEAGVFYNRINDYIFLREVDLGLNADGGGAPTSDRVADRVNDAGIFDPDGELLLLDMAQRNAEFYGAELSSRFRVIDQGPLRLSLRGFADTVRGKLQGDGSQNLPRITPSRFGMTADARYQRLSGSLGYTRVFEQDRLAPLETHTPGHDLLSADLHYRLHVGLAGSATVYLQGRNLLDETQRLATSFLKDVAPQPGRSLFVGLRFDFQPPSPG